MVDLEWRHDDLRPSIFGNYFGLDAAFAPEPQLLTHEADIISARQSLFLDRTQDVFLDRLQVGEGIVKIKGRLPPTHVSFKEINVNAGAIKDEDLKK